MPEILTKDLKSLINKSYRYNCVNNRKFPKKPHNGWIEPKNWFERTNDIVRTRFIVKYFDGVKYLVDEIQNIANKNDLKISVSYQAKDEGYYAAHIYFISKVNVLTNSFSEIIKPIKFEIQISTYIQDQIKTLLTKHYEANKLVLRNKNDKWQWDSESPEFSPRFLGHMLHYLESLIVEIRDKK